MALYEFQGKRLVIHLFAWVTPSAKIIGSVKVGSCCHMGGVGEWAIIGEMGLVKNNQEVPAGRIALGQPVKMIGTVTGRHKERWITSKKRYQNLIKRNNEGLDKI